MNVHKQGSTSRDMESRFTLIISFPYMSKKKSVSVQSSTSVIMSGLMTRCIKLLIFLCVSKQNNDEKSN